jgi:MFS superfamily sulfate permease-like transporter
VRVWGARTPVATLLSGLWALSGAWWLPPLVRYTPLAALAAVVCAEQAAALDLTPFVEVRRGEEEEEVS